MNLFDELRTREAAAPYERLARKALTSYGLTDAKITPVSVASRVVYRVTEGKLAYALAIHPHGWDRRAVERSLLWQTAICRSAVIRCPEPVLTLAGDLAQSLSTQGVSGFRTVELSSWVPGEALPPAEWSEELARRVGAEIGRLHAHGALYALPLEMRSAAPTAESLRTRLDAKDLAHKTDEPNVAVLADALDRVCEGLSCGQGLIHGRLRSRSILVESETGDLSIVGFHRTTMSYVALDLATLSLAFRGLHRESGLISALLDGYAETAPSEVEEGELVPYRLWHLLEEIAALEPDAQSGTKRRLLAAVQQLVEGS